MKEVYITSYTLMAQINYYFCCQVYPTQRHLFYFSLTKP